MAERALVLSDRHRQQAEVARDGTVVRGAQRHDVAPLVRDQQLIQAPRAAALAEQRAELGEQGERDEPQAVPRDVLEVRRGQVVELAAGLVLAAELGEHERQAAAPAAHRRQPVGVEAHERLELLLAPLRAPHEEHLRVGDDRRDRAGHTTGLRDGLGDVVLAVGELAAPIGVGRAVQRVVDEHPRLSEAAGRRAEGLDLLERAHGVVELEQDADAPEAHLHAELRVVRALAQLDGLDRDRQAAGHGLGTPDGDEPLGEGEREGTVAQHPLLA